MKKKKTPKLKIKAVRYTRLKNLGNYENERLEIEVEVPANQDAHGALLAAKKWVTDRLHGDEREHAFRSSGHGPVCICDECM